MKIPVTSMYMNYNNIYLQDQQRKSCLGGNPRIHLLENPIAYGSLSTFFQRLQGINYSFSEGTQSVILDMQIWPYPKVCGQTSRLWITDQMSEKQFWMFQLANKHGNYDRSAGLAVSQKIYFLFHAHSHQFGLVKHHKELLI